LLGSASLDVDDEVSQAYNFFDIKDRTAVLDFDVLDTTAAVKMMDDPSQEAQIRRHLDVLIKHGSNTAAAHQASLQADYSNPVGLSNMGNTCYLNCLLQYFYTIKPLRDVILDFDNHRMNTAPESFVPKKVGGRDISRPEVIKTLECMQSQSLSIDTY
jgi:ubiquitin carboxyl-terminal hydrolase 25/28